MKKRFLTALMVATAIGGFVGNANAEDIFTAMSSAYKTNPTLQAQRANLRSVDENVAIAKSGYRPTISLNGGYSDSNVNDDSNSANEGGDTTSLSAKISQPIFSGFQTVNSVKSADSYVQAEQNNLMNTEQNVLLEASTAYLDVLRDAAIVDLQKNNEKLLKKRLDETIERFNVGEVTRTDVSQAKARYSSAQAERISSEGDLEASKANYAKIIGNEPENLKEPENVNELLPKTYKDAYDYARVYNYSIQRAKYMLDSKNYDVASNTGALLPQVSLDGVASHTESDGSQYGSDQTVDNVEWSVNMTIPLYEGGATRAKIRQSKYLKWEAQEQVLEAERAVQSDVKSAWEYKNANEAQLKSIKDQIKANEVALDGVQKEEALGNRTILDVLNAYQELLNSKVEEVKAKRNYYVASMNLLMAMGKLTAKDLNLNVDLYDAKKHYEETKDKWFSISVDK